MEQHPAPRLDDQPSHALAARADPGAPTERQAAGGVGIVGAGKAGLGGMVNEQEHEEMIRQYEATLTKLRQDHARCIEELCAEVRLPTFLPPGRCLPLPCPRSQNARCQIVRHVVCRLGAYGDVM